ncbi:MAG: HD-GYP domain-containing protein [Pseudohongiella sp.]|nr:HD-GYP domain-containing protein [Pseudohongiella sp.]
MIKRISVKELKLGMFVQELHGSWIKHPFWKTKFLLDDPQDLALLKTCGIDEVSIDESRGASSKPQLEVKPTPVLTRTPASGIAVRTAGAGRVPVVKTEKSSFHQEFSRARELCNRSKSAVIDMFSEARMGRAVSMETANHVVEQITASVERHPQALITLARLKTADDYTYMHSVAVCAMMVALARELGMSDFEVRHAGSAGLLHDVGKMAVPDLILNKPGALTDSEFTVVKSHPVRGAEILTSAGDISTEVIDVCLHHHEKYDGSGYPHGLQGDQITRLARMGAICDVYDAITSNRPYKKGWGPAESLQRMAQWKGHFDPVLFQAFIKTIGIYPTGSLVRLSSQRLAVVIAQNDGSMLKPKVKVFFSVRSKLPVSQSVIDLSLASNTETIEAREPLEKWNFPYLDELWQSEL